jgi:hypothetical protein
MGHLPNVNLSHDAQVRAFADCDKAIFRVANAEGVPGLDLAARFSGQRELLSYPYNTGRKRSVGKGHR